MKFMKIGQLAKSTGLTVRTLHHYDQIGLLQPSGRETGMRYYSPKDIQRLQQIVSLKSVGFSLKRIAQCLDEEAYDLQRAFKLQERKMIQQLDELKNVLNMLQLLVGKLSQDENLSTTEILTFMHEVKKMEKFYTTEQLQYLQKRRDSFPDKVKEVESAWPKLMEKFSDAMKAGLKPTDLQVQTLASEAQLYIDLFTGGNPEIEANMDRFSKENRKEALKLWKTTEDVYEFAQQARRSLKEGSRS